MKSAAIQVPSDLGNDLSSLERTCGTLASLVDRLDRSLSDGTRVIPWGSPILSFGDLTRSRVATLGLNPSNREFVDEAGRELQGEFRRFHTLTSLGLASWSDLDAQHLGLILESCRSYFIGNPYGTWFKKLDQIAAGAEASYYDSDRPACHLDLIPYATSCKWTDLGTVERSHLLTITGNTLGLLLRDSAVQILILNGVSVVRNFEQIAGLRLARETVETWSLPRVSRTRVPGVAYSGIVDNLSGVKLDQRIFVLGFNHNLQSSFGITTKVISAIRGWIAQTTRRMTG